MDAFVAGDTVIENIKSTESELTEQKIEPTDDEPRAFPTSIDQPPRVKLVIAQRAYVARDSKKLSFSKGDVVRVIDESSKWHLGVLHQTTQPGHSDAVAPKHFPPNLFKPYDPDSGEQTVPVPAPDQVSQSAPQHQTQTKVYAKASFKATKEHQMSFAHGDVIRVVSSSGKWHKGVLVESSTYPVTGEVLLYPSNFIQADPPVSMVGSAETLNRVDQPKQLVVTLSDYEAKKPEVMSFAKGDLIEVIQTQGARGWHKGKLVRSSKYPVTGTVLFYPSNFVKAQENVMLKKSTARRSSVMQTRHDSGLKFQGTRRRNSAIYASTSTG